MGRGRHTSLRTSECPECGSIHCCARNTGCDEDGQTIRRRVCDNCGYIFGTVEIVLPEDFSFSRTDTFRKRERSKRVAFSSTDRLFIGSIRVIKGKTTDWCAKGLHKLKGNNLRLDRDGSRHCRACDNETKRQYRLLNRERMNARERARYRRKRERKEALT